MTDASAGHDPRDSCPRLLADIARTLESPDNAAGRVGRVLELVRALVFCDRCAVLHVESAITPALFVMPDVPADHVELSEKLTAFLQLLSEDEDAQPPAADAADAAGAGAGVHLALPLIGIGRVVGVVWVERSQDQPFEAHSLALLTVVAAMLATYITTVGLLVEQARVTQEISEAHVFQQLLVGIVSHDLRNPLAGVLNNAEVLRRRVQDAGLVKMSERIISSAQRATRIINDLLDLTRARLGDGIPIAPRAMNLSELLRQVIAESGSGSGGTVQVDAPDRVLGDWDPDRVAQIVTNLVSNAERHSPRGAEVRVTLREEEAGVVLEVHNRGTAIDEEFLPHLFDPFKRGERTRTGRHGLGLGLYIVREIAVGHGGRVGVHSTPEHGTTFTVELPRRPRPVPDAP